MHNLKIYPLGISYSTKELLFEPIDENDFGKALFEGLQQVGPGLSNQSIAISKGTSFRGELVADNVDLNNPHDAGWTFLINRSDRNNSALIEAIRPLAEFRGMEDPDSPLLFDATSEDDWADWIENEYQALDLESEKKAPHYILIVGDPIRVPFHFQSMLDTMASVGRVDFDNEEDLKAYVKKIIRLEDKENPPVVAAEATFFGTNHGYNGNYIDPTFFSHQYMVEPLADYVSQGLRTHFDVIRIMEGNATKQKFLSTLKTSKSALIYTASHGMGPSGMDSKEQKRITGAICCQNYREKDDAGVIMADDIPKDTPFLEGAVFFQFACFGYGIPKESDFEHWGLDNSGKWKMPQIIANNDFISSLPKKMLANPNGPIAFIGHVDTAMLHGFDDPESPYPLDEHWSPRILPFKKAIEEILGVKSVGVAMNQMNSRYDFESNRISRMYDKLRRNRVDNITEFQLNLSERWLSRADAQNHMVFGDPATRLRITTSDGFVAK
jgi:hypothetical protein